MTDWSDYYSGHRALWPLRLGIFNTVTMTPNIGSSRLFSAKVVGVKKA